MVTWKDTHWFTYLGMDERHDAAPKEKRKGIGMATIPLHRFASLEPQSPSGGWFLTHHFRMMTNMRLVVNAFLPVGGLITAEVYRKGGAEVIAGWSKREMVALKGPMDGYALECKWNDNEPIGALGAVEVQVRFDISGLGTRVYAFNLARGGSS